MMKKTISFLCVVVLMMHIVAIPTALASTTPLPISNQYIGSFNGCTSALGDGKIEVRFETIGTDMMDSIGASTVEIYNMDGLVYTFNMSNATHTSQMIGHDAIGFAGSVTYSGISGEVYYAIVTHYAAKGNGSGTERYTTNLVIA